MTPRPDRDIRARQRIPNLGEQLQEGKAADGIVVDAIEPDRAVPIATSKGRGATQRAGKFDSPGEVIDLCAVSDDALVGAVGSGRESALAEVYRRHGGAVHRLAKAVLGGDGRAEEVTQDVLVDLWRRPERFDSERGSLRSFLLASVHGRAVDIVRSDTARTHREQRSACQTAAVGYDLEHSVLDLTMADDVQDAIGRLSDAQRQVIVLAYLGGYTYRQVARILDVAEGTVKSRMRRGLRRLRIAFVEEIGPIWDQT